MPKGSKKRRASKLRKETANNHSPSTNSSAPQGDDHDGSDHALTEEEFSPRAAAVEHETVSESASIVPVEHQTVSESANNHSPSTNSSRSQGDDHDGSDHVLAEEEFSPRPAFEHQTVSELAKIHLPSTNSSGPQGDDHDRSDHALTEEEFSPCPAFEHQTVSESAKIHLPSTNSSGPQGDDHGGSDHALAEEEFSPRPAFEHQTVSESAKNHSPSTNSSEPQGDDHGSSGHAALEAPPQHEPEPETAIDHQTVSKSEALGAASSVTSDALDEPESTSWVPVEKKSISKSEKTEVPMSAASENFHKHVEEKSGEVNLHHEQNEVPQAVSRDAPTAGTAPLLGRRASWRNCCGLLDVFWGST